MCWARRPTGPSMRAISSMARCSSWRAPMRCRAMRMCAAISCIAPGSPRRQAWMDLVLYFLFFFPGIIAFIYSGYGFAAQSWISHEHSAYSPDGPPIYHYKTLIPVTGVLLLLQGIVEVVRCLVCIKHRRLAATAARRRRARKDHSRTACRCREPSHDRPATRRAHARPLRRPHHARLSDRLHADGDGRGLCLARL